MKVISNAGVIDFEKVVKLSYRESVFGNGYPVEIQYPDGSLFDNAVEIARPATKRCAYQLVCAITECWAAGLPVFDINKWLAKMQPEVAESPPADLIGERLAGLDEKIEKHLRAINNPADKTTM